MLLDFFEQEGVDVVKNVLDIYLKEKGLSREAFLKNEAFSEQKLAKVSKRDPENYSEETLNSLSEELNVASDVLLTDLKRIRDSDALFEVTTADELKQKVKEQEDEFLVKGDFRELMKEIKRSQVSETAELGFELGSGGSGTIVARGILRVLNLFENDRKLENLKQNIGHLYTIDFINEDEAKLRLKQLDY